MASGVVVSHVPGQVCNHMGCTRGKDKGKNNGIKKGRFPPRYNTITKLQKKGRNVVPFTSLECSDRLGPMPSRKSLALTSSVQASS